MAIAHPEPTYAAAAGTARNRRVGSLIGARVAGYAVAGGFSLTIWAALLAVLVRL
jgi:hypothetical protein